MHFAEAWKSAGSLLPHRSCIFFPPRSLTEWRSVSGIVGGGTCPCPCFLQGWPFLLQNVSPSTLCTRSRAPKPVWRSPSPDHSGRLNWTGAAVPGEVAEGEAPPGTALSFLLEEAVMFLLSIWLPGGWCQEMLLKAGAKWSGGYGAEKAPPMQGAGTACLSIDFGRMKLSGGGS